MRNPSFVTLALAVVVMFGACDDGPERRSPVPQPSPVVPTPEPPPPPPPPPPPSIPPGTRVIGLGEEVKDRLVDYDKHFVVTAPSHGTLAVRLTVPPEVQDSGAMVLRLKLNGTNFPSGCCGWDYRQVGPLAEEGLPFVLITALE